MNKSLIFTSCLLFTLAFSQNLGTVDITEDSPILIGGYQTLSENEAQDDPMFMEIQDFARAEYSKKNSGGQLGVVKHMERQLVAGFNYKFVFASENGDVEIIVFDQAWTSTRQITSIRSLENPQ